MKKCLTALTLAKINQDNIKVLQASDLSTQEKLLCLENDGKKLNLQLWGIDENTEGVISLCNFIATWLTHELQLEEDVVPIIYSACRIGVPNNLKYNFPQDVIITLADPQVCIQILDLARSRGALSLHGKPYTGVARSYSRGIAIQERLKANYFNLSCNLRITFNIVGSPLHVFILHMTHYTFYIKLMKFGISLQDKNCC